MIPSTTTRFTVPLSTGYALVFGRNSLSVAALDEPLLSDDLPMSRFFPEDW
ncbi:hypothetical protein ACIQXD_35225 [Streptomyces uncialis]|uniref:hypothetical protein n=1 Tax=Streptomyces uncialis TaxID=1048205 RepID=UPI00382F4995